MGSVLFAGAHRDQQPRVAREDGAHRVGGENAQVQRQAHVVIAGCFAVLATAEWLRSDAAIWAALAGAAGVVALVLAVRPPGPRHTLSVAAALASAVLDDNAAWAGRHRTIPAPDDTTELQVVMTPFYAVLEARRQTRTATSVGSVLLSATPAIADGDQSLTALFEGAHGVSLRLFPPGQGPRDSSVFEICTPRTPPPEDCAPGDTLFSVQTIPPSQG